MGPVVAHPLHVGVLDIDHAGAGQVSATACNVALVTSTTDSFSMICSLAIYLFAWSKGLRPFFLGKAARIWDAVHLLAS